MRILITGPECSGKSTLASQLSEKLSVPWFPEYARTYLEEHGSDYEQKDIVNIAKKHAQLFKVFPPDQPLILDTYLLNLKIWSEHKYNLCDKWILEEIRNTAEFDLVLLMAPDLTWVQDGLRENSENTEELFTSFQNELAKLNWDYSVISGQGSNRLESALKLVSKLSL